MLPDNSKEKISQLIVRYESLTTKEVRDYNESMICKDFVLPLFEALGWDVYNKTIQEVTSEHVVSGKRVDYAFRLNHVIRFFLEAKRPSVDLREQRWADQAISYSWHKSVPWAILTNFESIRVFNAEWNEPDAESSLVFEISYKNFLTDNNLWKLSRQSIEKGELDTWADENYRRPKKEPVDRQLAKDLIKWRTELFEHLEGWNRGKQLTPKIIARAVQNLLDRLIFIRTTEDRGIEGERLNEITRNYLDAKKRVEAKTGLSEVFKNYDEWYDSKLFDHQLCDDLDYADEILVEILQELYKNKKGIRYNFADINADVLGRIYEQYLGQIQSEELEPRLGKRRSQGIYYTPRYIVDFIVNNTVDELAKGKSAVEIQQFKVLDSACGSGSFLIQAFQSLDKLISGEENSDDLSAYRRRLGILTSNIYGVDLDEEAVEIAQLNLLLKVLGARERLPNLTHNIECGNSLIEGTPEELENKLGEHWREKKAFNWHERFPDIFKDGGFDVIIGNPPYIKEYVDKSAFDGLHDDPYYQGKMDIWTLFACRAIDHLKDGGYFSFIAPNSWLTNAGASIFRDKILRDGEIISFIDFGDFKVFKDAGIQTMIFTFKKKRPRSLYALQYAKVLDSEIAEDKIAAFLNSNLTVVPEGVARFEIKFEPEKFLDRTISFSNREDTDVIGKIEKEGSMRLDPKDVGQGIVSPQEYVTRAHIAALDDPSSRVGEGIFVVSNSELEALKLTDSEKQVARPYYESTEIGRFYADKKNKKWIFYMDSANSKKIDSYPKIKAHLDKFGSVMTSDFAPYGLHRARDQKFFDGGVILSLRKTAKPAFSYVDFPCYVSQSFYAIKPKNIDPKYLTAVLNSKVAYYWFKNRGKVQGENLQIDKEPLMNFPIIATGDKNKIQTISTLVDETIALYTEFHGLEPILYKEEREELQGKITKLETEIDEIIYGIYGLDADDQEIIEKAITG